MKKKDPFVSVADSAWEMFSKTGNVSYYLFYKKLTDKE